MEKSKILTGMSVMPGDIVLGLASSGVHSNGFSLVRKCIERAGSAAPALLDGKPFRQALMEPTRLYVKSILAALDLHPIKALAHITGAACWKTSPRVARGNGRPSAPEQLAPQRTVCLAAADGGDRRLRDEPHLQQRHRNGGRDRCRARRRLRGSLRAAGEQVFEIGRIQARGDGASVELI